MSFEVEIEEFNGPYDKMLELIAKHKLDLLNLDINELTTQYINYIKSMQDIHLEIASEYLVEMANLIMIKSRRLLPVEQIELEANAEEDPKEKLVRRLIEYQKFKEASFALADNFEERLLHYTKLQSEIQVEREDEGIPTNMDSTDLLKAFQKMYQRIALTNPQARKFEVTEVSVEERQTIVRHKLATSSKTKFNMLEILNDCVNMQEFVITFVVLLDMASHGEIHFNFLDDDVVEVEKGAYVDNGEIN